MSYKGSLFLTRLSSNPRSHMLLRYHISLASFNIEQFLSLSLCFLNLILLKNTGQFCLMFSQDEIEVLNFFQRNNEVMKLESHNLKKSEPAWLPPWLPPYEHGIKDSYTKGHDPRLLSFNLMLKLAQIWWAETPSRQRLYPFDTS